MHEDGESDTRKLEKGSRRHADACVKVTWVMRAWRDGCMTVDAHVDSDWAKKGLKRSGRAEA